ncbi:MAG: stage III sporulation protein AB [Eubacteriales bacterium]|nr:stage III sporulation protein AB [Eubacteriales bacterium]
MLKAAGMCLILAGTTGIGNSMARELDQRTAQIQELQRLTLLLQGEIRCVRQPLPDAFRRLGEEANEPFSDFFRETARELESRSGATASGIWERNVRRIRGRLRLSAGELKELEELGSMLGYLDVTMQLETLRYYERRLEAALAQAKETADSRRRLYRYLGALGGAAIVLLLL